MPTPPRSRIRCSPGIAGAVGAALFALVGIVWSLSSPLMGAPDEPAQTVKAVAVARGELRGDDTVYTADAPPGENRVDTQVRIPEGYAEAADLNACYVFQPEVPVGCAPLPSDDEAIVTGSTYIGTYPPVYYALVGWPSRFLSADNGLWAMRFASVAVSAAMVGLALTACRRIGRAGLVGGGLLLALTPMTVYFASVINSNGFEITAAVAVWATALAVFGRRHLGPPPAPGSAAGSDRFDPTTGDLVRLAVAFVLLTAIRPLSPLMGLGIVLAVLLVAADIDTLRSLGRRVDARLAGLAMAVGLATSIGWLAWSRAYDSVAGTPIPGLTLGTALRESTERLPTRLLEMIGYFAYREVPAPRSLVLLWSAMVLILLLGALALGTWRHRAVLVAVIVAALAFNVVPEALSAPKYGFIGQGRYALPIAVGVPLVAAWVVALRGRWPARWWAPTAVVVALAWAVGVALGQAALLRRNTVGVTNGFFEFLGASGWDPPLPSAVLWAAGGLTAAAFALWTTVIGAASDPERSDPPPSVPSGAREQLVGGVLDGRE